MCREGEGLPPGRLKVRASKNNLKGVKSRRKRRATIRKRIMGQRKSSIV